MKKILLFTLMGVMTACSLNAATKVTTGDAALAQAGPKNGIVVFTYAEDWDEYSKALCKKLMANQGVLDALGDAAILPYPCYDVETEAQEAELTKMRGELDIPRVLSYPAIILFDAKGRHAATLQGRELTAYTTDSIAKLIKQHMGLIAKQNSLLAKADATDGVAKAKLLGRAANMPDLVAPKDVVKAITALDPKDESGYVRGLSTDEWKMSANVAEIENMKDMMAFVDKVVADEAYSTKVKQTAMIRLIGQWRTLGTREQLPTMRQYAEKVIKLDPSNYHAISARYMIDVWLRSFTLESGWFEQMMPQDDRLVMMEGPIPMKDAGVYTITMQHTGGRYALTMTSVSLFDGKELVAKDVHEGIAGDKPKNTVYTLEVPRKVKDPKLGFTFNQGNKTWTEGKFVITKIQ
ncbi:MAG: hypothetical protein R3Y56_06955 [Akkermansia sp.]